MKYLIFTDVSADLDAQYASDNNVHFIPMEYSLGDDMRLCKGPEGVEIMKKFYDGQRNGDMTKTSQISPYMYQQHFSPYMEQGYSILYFCLSSGLSSTFQSALVAKAELKEEYPEVDLYPIDTLAATGGMGVLVEKAVLYRDKYNYSVEENYTKMVEHTKEILHWFMVEDLMYLKRGGRLSAATAIAGTALGVKPILRIDKKGMLINIAKKRGVKSAISELVEKFKASEPAVSEDDVIYIVHADAEENAELLKEKILEIYPDVKIKTSYLTPIIGAHTGPGMVAVCHLGADWA